ncbi:NUDIX domain-containing protein [Streptomyces sp. NPDC001922]|uniref:NUDIX hydrolase n=1 Tax=Streptomyces sp. NPDC001922 TaxID=3364624 RepID=UPI0036779FF2
MTHEPVRTAPRTGEDGAPLTVAAAAIVQDGRLLVVSKKAAPHVFYLPGGKPEQGETPLEALVRELGEELGAEPVEPSLLAEIDAMAALEEVPMRLTVFRAGLSRPPVLAAELADLRWISGHDSGLTLAPALRDHVLPLLYGVGALTA